MIVFNHTDSDFNYAKDGEFYNIPAKGFADIDEALGITAEDLIGCYGTRISIKESLEEQQPVEAPVNLVNGEKEDETKEDETKDNNGTTAEDTDNTKDKTPEGSDEDEEDIPTVDDIVKDVVDAADKAVKEVKTQVKRGRPAKSANKKKK